MPAIKCVSSQLMTQLLTWRNPQGAEEGWMQDPGRQIIQNKWKHVGKLAVAEVGLALLHVISAIETVSYSILTVASLALYPLTNRPCKFFAKLLGSSSFTMLWSAADALLYNPFFVNVMTQESFARYWAQKFNPSPLPFMRIEDDLHIADWQQQHPHEVQNPLLGPIQAHGLAIHEVIEQGAHFLNDEVLAGASPDTIQKFKELDPTIYLFILTKATYIYAAGSKKEAPIPDFFKQETKAQILEFRSRPTDDTLSSALERLMENPNSFEKGTEEDPAKSAFTALRKMGSNELQNGLLVTRCWQKATEPQ